jgi:hypothetical protein
MDESNGYGKDKYGYGDFNEAAGEVRCSKCDTILQAMQGWPGNFRSTSRANAPGATTVAPNLLSGQGWPANIRSTHHAKALGAMGASNNRELG